MGKKKIKSDSNESLLSVLIIEVLLFGFGLVFSFASLGIFYLEIILEHGSVRHLITSWAILFYFFGLLVALIFIVYNKYFNMDNNNKGKEK